MNRATYHRLRRDAWRAAQAAAARDIVGADRPGWLQGTLQREADIARRSVPRPYCYAQDLFQSQQLHRRQNVLYLVMQRRIYQRRGLSIAMTNFELRRALTRLASPCVPLPARRDLLSPDRSKSGSGTAPLAPAVETSVGRAVPLQPTTVGAIPMEASPCLP